MKITSAELSPGALGSSNTDNIFTREKSKTLYFLSVIVFTCTCTYFFGSMLQQDASVWSAGIFAAIFFCAGIIHIFLFPRWLSPAKNTGFNKNLLYSVIVAASIYIASLIVVWSSQFHLKTLCLIAGISFLLPALAMECFQMFFTLPKVIYQPWYLPSGMPEKKMSLLLNSTLFKIHVQLKKTDERAVLFNMTLPKRLTVNVALHHFFYDHQEAIELYENKQPYGWIFYIKTWYGMKAVDPNLSLKENGIKEDDIIYAKRATSSPNN